MKSRGSAKGKLFSHLGSLSLPSSPEEFDLPQLVCGLKSSSFFEASQTLEIEREMWGVGAGGNSVSTYYVQPCQGAANISVNKTDKILHHLCPDVCVCEVRERERNMLVT